ncbi:hypothetical protein DSAG12_00955 [Promethearchaeum syntrophicum]|uniref:Uncharacterized protein n=1 Tax=Promethearchaeum syntrophicum TaxID=2594042 RepID=A0A5B9D7Q4_9ARCH|nr:hypothetical protein [Candidatus Prometheoarchaeum syntrophicum]QEE15132.1 hypothetical protein DSAG12_00955 [Candidatus Prometheoarchaeum syntrophicum]
MTNQNTEDHLKRALKEGNLINVGQNSISKENKKGMISTDSKFNKTYFKYNLPIGIDFGKSLKPNNFLTSLEILDRILEIPNISEQNRFKLENLRLYLTTGKIWHYKRELKTLLEDDIIKQEKAKETKSPKEITENTFISLLISLHFILTQASITNVKWVSQNQILTYIESTDQKKILHEWKTKNYGKLPEDLIFLSLISQTLIQKISQLNIPEDQYCQLNDLKNLVISAKFSKILNILSLKLNSLSPIYLSSIKSASNSKDKEATRQVSSDINNIFIYRILVTLNILQKE